MTTDPRHMLADPDLFARAACIGRWALFDPQHDGEARDDYLERTSRARGHCGRCPALTACRDYTATLPTSHRVGNTLAGTT